MGLFPEQNPRSGLGRYITNVDSREVDHDSSVIELYDETPVLVPEVDHQTVGDDGASINVDEQDVIEIESALKIVNDADNNPELTEYEQFRRDAARELISQEFRSRSRFLSVGNIAERDYSDNIAEKPVGFGGVSLRSSTRTGEPKTMAAGGFDEEEPFHSMFYPKSHVYHVSSAFPNGLDEESVFTIDIDRERSLLRPQRPAEPLGRSFASWDLVAMISGITLGSRVHAQLGLALKVGGPMGMSLGVIFGIAIYMCIWLPVVEMMGMSPQKGSYPGYIRRYLHSSVAFATGLSYFVGCLALLPSSLLKTTAVLSPYPELMFTAKSQTVWVTFLILLTIGINLMPPRMLARGGFLTGWLLLLIFVMSLIYMFVLNSGIIKGSILGHVGFRYWDHSRTRFPEVPFGLFPTFYDKSHIKGGSGRFLGVCYATLCCLNTLTNLDKVLTTVPEARTPRKTMCRVASALWFRVLVLQLLLTLSVTLSMPYSDPMGDTQFSFAAILNSADNFHCPRMVSFDVRTAAFACGLSCDRWKYQGHNMLGFPWYVGIARQGFCNIMYLFNSYIVVLDTIGTLIVLYATARTLYAMSVEKYFYKWFSNTSRDQVPYVAVLVSSLGVLACYIQSSADPTRLFLVLDTISVLFTFIFWIVMAFTAVRFRRAVDASEFISRHDADYPYRSPVGPKATLAAAAALIVLLLTYPVLLAAASNVWIARLFLIMYFPPVAWVLFVGYHWLRSRPAPANPADIDFTRAKELLDEQEWEEDRVYHGFRGTLNTGRRYVLCFLWRQCARLRLWSDARLQECTAWQRRAQDKRVT